MMHDTQTAPHAPELHGASPDDVDRNGLWVMTRDDCLRRLAGACLGRVGVSIDALPAVLPVNYRLVEDQIVLRTSPGTKLAAAASGAVVAFEIDGTDPVSHAGWSVMVVGVAHVVEDLEERSRFERIGIPRWAPGPAEVYVAIDTARVSGREVGRR
jgi:hypothetical protein